MQPPQKSHESKSVFHNIKEKILHPIRHDTDTNITHPTKEHKHVEEHEESAADQPLVDTKVRASS